MHRAIAGYQQDEEDEWVARLTCGHGQHVRHKPPFMVRYWILSEEGRTTRVGSVLDCLRCDRLELPESVSAYKRTPTYDEQSLPLGLTRSHTTKAGVWAVIHVLHGDLEYVIEGSEIADAAGALPPQRFMLTAGKIGVICPEVPHHVSPIGAVQFYVEFHREVTL